MVNLYVGITDYEWFRYLSALPSVEEVNFWQPGGRTNFRALKPGELFLFKLHAPRNFIVGGGVFARADILPVSLAWEAFGIGNGAASLLEMRKRIAYYRNQADDFRQEYMIGCRILTQPFFFPEDQWVPVPASWSPHIQQGEPTTHRKMMVGSYGTRSWIEMRKSRQRRFPFRALASQH
jgi:putative restriction endonuclease